jgi:oligosaccharyltransferase complex subunit alpha (ribophorin I)
MKSAGLASLLFVAISLAADLNLSAPLSPQQILPRNFKPPQVFKNINSLRTINLEKGFVRESINLFIENVHPSPQDEYYLPIDADAVGKVGGFHAGDKNDQDRPVFRSDAVYDASR